LFALNILIFGAGDDKKRFGRSFVNRAIKDSHTVYEFSYRLEKESADEISERFQNLIETLPRIDIMLYNVMAGHYPGMPGAFISSHKVDFQEWQETMLINVELPHMFAIKSLCKMDKDSAIVFMTSTGSYLPSLDPSLSKYAGYFGSKAAQNHLMWAMSEFNDKKVTVCSVAPHFPYEDEKTTEVVINQLYKKIININAGDNGKIISCTPPLGIITTEKLSS
jgi:short-subunit dehydrogenase